MRLLKKAIVVIVVVCMMLALYPLEAMALTEGPFIYEVLDDGTVEITGYVLNYTGPLVIPAQLSGRTVSAIGTGALQMYGMSSVTLPAGIKRIEEFAFSRCDNLTSVTLNQGLLSIANRAFERNPMLAGITIPSSVTSIDYTAFDNCPAMTSINVSSANMAYSSVSGVLYDKAGTKLIRCPEGKTGALALPGGVQSVNSYSFFQSKELTGVTMQNGVTNIGENAFYACEKLKNISLPSSLTSIGNWAFGNCTCLTSITLPVGVTSIGTVDIFNPGGNTLFHNCSSLSAINVDSANTAYSSVSGVLYDKARTKLIRCPEGKTGTLTLPSTVKGTGIQSAMNCKELTGITMPAGMTEIEMDSFANCTGLTSVTIPAKVNKIDSRGFSDCGDLTEAFFLGDAPTLGNDVFYEAASRFTVYYQIDKAGWTTPTWKGYSAIPAPAPPTIAVASVSFDSIRISWNKISGANGYEVYRAVSSGGAYSKIYTAATGGTVTCVDSGLMTMHTYYYKVRAWGTVDSKKVYGSFSEVRSAMPGEYTDVVSGGKLTRTYYNGDGSIKRVEEYYGASDTSGLRKVSYYTNGVRTTYRLYNTAGKLTSLVELYSSGKTKKVSYYSTSTGKRYAYKLYDTAGRMTNYVYTYGDGVKPKKTNYYNVSTGIRTAYKLYDTAGRMTHYAQCYADGVKAKKMNYYNVSTGIRTGYKTYRTDGSCSCWVKCDSKGNPSVATYYDSKGKVTKTVKY